MTRRRAHDDDRRPRRFDPKQRGRDRTNTRSRRKRGHTEQTIERRIEDLETWSYMNTSVATQAAATTLIEVVTELPDPTYLDIGRQIILRSPAAVHDILYVGMQLPDDSVAWIQWTSNYSDSPNSPEFTWIKHYSQGVGHRGVHMNATYVYFTRDGQYVQRYTIATGGVAVALSGIPIAGNTGFGVYAEDTGPKIWVTVPGIDKIQYYDTAISGSINNTIISGDFWALKFGPVSGRFLTTERASNKATIISKPGLTTVNSAFSTDNLAPEGIAEDPSGNIYIADTGNNRIRKYNSSLVHQFNWGSFGSSEGAFFNAPKGLAIDASGRIYVCDSGNSRILVFDNGGNYLGKFGIGGTGNGQFSNPNEISIYGNTIVVNDFGNSRLSFWTRT